MARSAASDGTPRFADLLNHLFATRLSPRCKPFPLKEVSEGTGGYFSVAYLSLLRRGGIERPSLERMRRLADFSVWSRHTSSGRSALRTVRRRWR